MPGMKSALVPLLLFVASAISACAREPSSPATPEAPRVAVISPALGVIVRDLGLAPSVVARHAWDTAFPEVPSVGDQTAIDYERLRRVRPTHVLLQWGARPLPPRLEELAGSERWSIVNVEILTYDDIADAVSTVARAVGGDDANARAVELAAALDRAATVRPGLGDRAGSTLSLYGVSPLGVAGPGSFTSELVGRLGARPVPETGSPYVAMDPEDLRRLDPDTIVVWAPGIGEAEQADVLAPLARLGLRSAREGRVVFITHPGALLPSTTMIDAAEELAAKLLALPRVG